MLKARPDKIISNEKFKRWNGWKWILYYNCVCYHCKKEIIRSEEYYKIENFCRDCFSMGKLKRNSEQSYNILKKIDLEEFYYLIGLICTDGHIGWPNCTKNTNGYTCMITLNNKDSDLLYDIQKLFGGIIVLQPKLNATKWQISNKDFVLYLKNVVGLTNNKSLTLNVEKWFQELPNKFKIPFLRGVIDGDGCIYRNKKYGHCVISIATYSENFFSMLKKYFNSKTTIKKGRLQIFNKPELFIDIMSFTKLQLKRKTDIYQQLTNLK